MLRSRDGAATAFLVVVGVAQNDDVTGPDLILDPPHRDQRIGPGIPGQRVQMNGRPGKGCLQQEAEGLLVVDAVAEHIGIAQDEDPSRSLGWCIAGKSRSVRADGHHGVEMFDLALPHAAVAENVSSRVCPITLLGILGEEAARAGGSCACRSPHRK